MGPYEKVYTVSKTLQLIVQGHNPSLHNTPTYNYYSHMTRLILQIVHGVENVGLKLPIWPL